MKSIESSMKRWSWNEVEKCWELMKNGKIDGDEGNDDESEVEDLNEDDHVRNDEELSQIDDENGEDGVDQLIRLEPGKKIDGTDAQGDQLTRNMKTHLDYCTTSTQTLNSFNTSSSQQQQSQLLQSIKEKYDEEEITSQCNEGSSLQSSSQHLVRECKIDDTKEKVNHEMELIESSMKRWTWNKEEKCWELMKNGQNDGGKNEEQGRDTQTTGNDLNLSVVNCQMDSDMRENAQQIVNDDEELLEDDHADDCEDREHGVEHLNGLEPLSDICVAEVNRNHLVQKGTMQQHLKSQHEKTGKHVCPHCDRAFQSPSRFENHIRIHTGHKLFVCTWENCRNAFTQIQHFKDHMSSHTEEKSHKCPWKDCTSKFTYIANLYRHFKMHTKVKPFKCPWEDCYEEFSGIKQFKVHLTLPVHTLSSQQHCPPLQLNEIITKFDVDERFPQSNENFLQHSSILSQPPQQSLQNSNKDYQYASECEIETKLVLISTQSQVASPQLVRERKLDYEEEDVSRNKVAHVVDNYPNEHQVTQLTKSNNQSSLDCPHNQQQTLQHQQEFPWNSLFIFGSVPNSTLSHATLQHFGREYKFDEKNEKVYDAMKLIEKPRKRMMCEKVMVSDPNEERNVEFYRDNQTEDNDFYFSLVKGQMYGDGKNDDETEVDKEMDEYDQHGDDYSTNELDNRLNIEATQVAVPEKSSTRKFVCKVCGKEFKLKYKLASHFRVHTGERPFKCPLETCNLAFVLKTNCLRHLKTHTGVRPDDIKKYLKEFFQTEQRLENYLQTLTVKRSFRCTWIGCNKCYTRKEHLKKHFKTHTKKLDKLQCHATNQTVLTNSIESVPSPSHRHNTIPDTSLHSPTPSQPSSQHSVRECKLDKVELIGRPVKRMKADEVVEEEVKDMDNDQNEEKSQQYDFDIRITGNYTGLSVVNGQIDEYMRDDDQHDGNDEGMLMNDQVNNDEDSEGGYDQLNGLEHGSNIESVEAVGYQRPDNMNTLLTTSQLLRASLELLNDQSVPTPQHHSR